MPRQPSPSSTQAPPNMTRPTLPHLLCLLALLSAAAGLARSAEPALVPAIKKPAVPSLPASAATDSSKSTAQQLREGLEPGGPPKKRLTLVINGKEKKYITMQASEAIEESTPAKAAALRAAAPGERTGGSKPPASRPYTRPRAAALAAPLTAPLTKEPPKESGPAAAEAAWSYQGETGPPAWGSLKPEFVLCGTGKRQSPINIDDAETLQGPAEPLQFNYPPSEGSVVNNGYTIQVDVSGDNLLTVRGSTYKLLHLQFHAPSEERINFRSYAMVAHLVHRNAEGQLAIVAVLLDPGTANNLIHKIWTHMPLDTGDRVRLPTGLIDLNELLPKEQRYYQFFGSLTTPPCTEGVLWLVFKQPTSISREQLRLFTQLFPNNARPVQATNGRPVRSGK